MQRLARRQPEAGRLGNEPLKLRVKRTSELAARPVRRQLAAFTPKIPQFAQDLLNTFFVECFHYKGSC